MERLRGTVSNLRYSIDVSGTRNGISTSHLALLELGGQPVSFEGMVPALITDGDEVEVAGYRRRGVFEAYAYRNITKKVAGNAGYMNPLILGVLFPMFGLMAIKNFSDTGEVFIGVLFIGIGVALLYRSAKIRRAIRMLG